MENKEAIEAIRSNWPDEKYSILREALTKAIAALECGTQPTSTNTARDKTAVYAAVLVEQNRPSAPILMSPAKENESRKPSHNTGMAGEVSPQICPRCKNGAPVICQACYEQILKRVDYR
jgi:hypothetical protein